MRKALTVTSALLLSALTAFPAMAHSSGAETASLFSGLLHPLTGIDHLLTMLAVGTWLVFQTKKAQLSTAFTFVIMLLAGFVLGIGGFYLPAVESGIAVSVLILGLLITSRQSVSTSYALPLAAIFALFHGFAHGAEVSGAIVALFATGFILTCITLMASGFLGATLLKKQLPGLNKMIGVAIATAGGAMLAV